MSIKSIHWLWKYIQGQMVTRKLMCMSAVANGDSSLPETFAFNPVFSIYFKYLIGAFEATMLSIIFHDL